MFSSLLDVFSPRELSFRFDDDSRVDLERLGTGNYAGVPLWSGEEVMQDPLTRCIGDGGAELIRELGKCLATRSPTKGWVGASGPLRHVAQHHKDPEWFGRWRQSPTTLETIVSINFTWSDAERELEISFPLSGYPLTASDLTLDGRIVKADPEPAIANRALIMPLLGGARSVLRLPSESATWRLEGDFGWHYPADEADLKRVWFPRLSA